MIILMRKKNLVIIGLLLMSIIIFWSGYQRLGHEEGLSYEKEVALPTMAPVTPAPSEQVPAEEVAPLPPATPMVAEIPAVPESAPNEVIAPSEASQDEIIQMRLERNRNRDLQIETLEKLAGDVGSTAEIKAEAQRKILLSSDERFMESQAETLLKTKGYQNTLVLIDLGNATVFVGDDLVEEDYLKIGDLVHKSTKFSLEEIIIVPKAV